MSPLLIFILKSAQTCLEHSDGCQVKDIEDYIEDAGILNFNILVQLPA